MSSSDRKWNIELKFFDINMISDDSVVVFIGRRRTGKSYTLKDLLYNNRNIPYGYVCSATEEASPFFKDFIPSSYISTEFSEKAIGDILTRQKKIREKQLSGDPKFKNIDPRMLVVLDDCLYDDSWSKTIPIRNIFMNGRHYKLFFLLTMQYVMGIPPALRTNIDYTFIMREPYMSNRKRIYENFASMFPTFQMFCKVMDQLDKHECLVVCNNSDERGLTNQVFFYKARDNGNFKFGCEQYWKNHEQQQLNKKNAKQKNYRNASEYEKKSKDEFIVTKKYNV